MLENFTQQHIKHTCKTVPWGLYMLITGEKLLLTGTFAPRNGRILYGFWMPTPDTCFTQNNVTTCLTYTNLIQFNKTSSVNLTSLTILVLSHHGILLLSDAVSTIRCQFSRANVIFHADEKRRSTVSDENLWLSAMCGRDILVIVSS